MHRDDLLWLAGLIEGEGCFQPGPAARPNKCTISVQMTDKDIVERVARLFDRKMWQVKSKQKEHHNDSYIARISGYPAKELMLTLRPLMGERRRAQIDRAIAGMVPPKLRISREEQDRIQRMHFCDGLSGNKIAAETGHTPRTVRKCIRGDYYKEAEQT
jgi:hypothetical protein